MSKRAQFRIATSGWNYKDWRGRFYPKDLPMKKWFAHYAGVFDTVEIDNSFYHLPTGGTFDDWNKQAPRGFLYAVKASRFITHLKKLKNARQPVRRFLKRARRLGNHLGPILYQLPPHWKPNLERLAKFCEQLPGDLKHVIEFRDRTWLNEKTYVVLEKHGICLCVHDMLKRHPRRVTGKSVYVRFHGTGSKYSGSYSRGRLRRWANWMRQTARSGHDVYAYFNNDRRADAVRNALTLRELLGAT